MSNIKLYYWKGLNFGDLMSPYLVEKLSGEKPIYRKTTFKGFIHQLIDSIFKVKSIVLFFRLIKSFLTPGPILLGAGSIADISNRKTVAWGAGLMIPDSKVNSGKFVAVRGKLSGKIILKRGLSKKLVYGDPGLLLPIVYPKKKEPNSRTIGIIPHIKDYNFFETQYQDKYKIINLANADVESIVDQILQCGYILSSSLHGLIEAHAYGIPAIWIERQILEKSGFKFNDYFTSVEIPEYRGFRNFKELLATTESAESFFKQNKKISLPNMDIRELQIGLLKQAPFKILPLYTSKF